MFEAKGLKCNIFLVKFEGDQFSKLNEGALDANAWMTIFERSLVRLGP